MSEETKPPADPKVIYDHRERACGLPGLLLLAGVEIVEAQLGVGDYLVSERLCIERKSSEDFVASLKDGRLFDQADRLNAAYERAVIVIEGKPRMRRNTVDGALASLIRRGLSVITVRELDQSASLITRMAIQEARAGVCAPRRVKTKRPERLHDEVSEDLLASLPGVSIGRARALLTRYGSLSEIACRSSAELAEVDGIGAKTAAAIHTAFAHRWRN